MSHRILKTAVLLAACVPALAMAQQPKETHREGSWEFSLGAGGVLVDSKLKDFLASGAPEQRFAKTASPSAFAPTAVVRLGYNISQHMGVSISGEAAMAEGIKYYTPGAALTYTFDLNDRTSPFLLIGSEITRIEGENARVTHSTWGADAGIGIRHMLTETMALRLEARAKFASYKEVPMASNHTITPLATIGFSWFMGGNKPHAMMMMPMRHDTVRTVRVDTLRSMIRDTVRFVRVDTVASLNLDQVVLRVQFRTDKAELLAISYKVLDTVAAAIKATPDSKWMVEGHTDSVGTAAYNQTLSQARAQTVADYLVSKGVDRGILTATGFGFDRPVFSNTTEAGRAQNRRVQLRRIPAPPTVRVP